MCASSTRDGQGGLKNRGNGLSPAPHTNGPHTHLSRRNANHCETKPPSRILRQPGILKNQLGNQQLERTPHLRIPISANLMRKYH